MLYISPFKLSMFLECPRRYKFHYVDDLAKEFKVPKPYLTMGENVHQALKEFFTKLEPEERNQERLEEILRNVWRKNREGFAHREEERKYGLEALDMLRRFIQTQDVSRQPLVVEKTYKVPLDKETILIGKIDRIDKYNEEKIIIVDYKTGNEPIEEDMLQLTIYAAIASRRLKKDIHKASYLYLRTGQEKSISPSSKDLENGLLEIKAIAEMIEKEEKFPPKINRFCSFCEYLSICPLKEEIEKNKKSFADVEEPF